MFTDLFLCLLIGSFGLSFQSLFRDYMSTDNTFCWLKNHPNYVSIPVHGFDVYRLPDSSE